MCPDITFVRRCLLLIFSPTEDAHPHLQNDPESCEVEDPQAGQPGQENVCKFMHNV